MLDVQNYMRIKETDEIFFIQHGSGVILYIPKRILENDEIKQIKQFSNMTKDKFVQ